MTRIKAVLLGDAGSGVVTAGPTLGLSVMQSHLWEASEFPKFGAARKGAQVMSSGEFAYGEDIASGHPFSLDEADLVGFLGLDTLTQENILKTPEHAVIVANVSDVSQSERKFYIGGRQVWVVPATKIALQTIGFAKPNTPILGALVRAMDDQEPFSLNHLKTALRQTLKKQSAFDANLQAIQQGYDQVVRVEGIAVRPEDGSVPQCQPRLPAWHTYLPGGKLEGRIGNTEQTDISAWGSMRAMLDLDKCNGCGRCASFICSDNALVFRGTYLVEIVADRCKGDGQCVAACPVTADAIHLVEKKGVNNGSN